MKDHNTQGAGPSQQASELLKNKEAISKLAQTDDAQRLMALLRQGGGVEEEAQAAASGSPAALMKRMKQLMSTQEGAALIQRINEQARESGLTK